MSTTEVNHHVRPPTTTDPVSDLKLEAVVIPVADVDRAEVVLRRTGLAAGRRLRLRQRLPGRPVHRSWARRRRSSSAPRSPPPSRARPRASTWWSPTSRRPATSSPRSVSTSARCSTPSSRAPSSCRAGRLGPAAGPRGRRRELRLVRDLRGPGRQHLAAAGGHHPAARPHRQRDARRTTSVHDLSRRSSGPRPRTASTRSARRRVRRAVAGLVRGVHGRRAGRRRAPRVAASGRGPARRARRNPGFSGSRPRARRAGRRHRGVRAGHRTAEWCVMLTRMIDDDVARPVAERPGRNPPEAATGAGELGRPVRPVGVRVRRRGPRPARAGGYARPSFDASIVVPFPPESARLRQSTTPACTACSGTTACCPRPTHRGGHDDRAARDAALRRRRLPCRSSGSTGSASATTRAGTRRSRSTSPTLLRRRRDVLVVRAEDDPHDVAQPRGKQDWREHPHVIWYHRTSGIWQPVWLESVPAARDRLPPLDHRPARRTVTATRRPDVARPVRATPVARRAAPRTTRPARDARRTSRPSRDRRSCSPLPALTNGQAYEELLWSPSTRGWSTPRLGAARTTGSSSYLGPAFRRVDRRGTFLLNDRPYYVRSVLSQGVLARVTPRGSVGRRPARRGAAHQGPGLQRHPRAPEVRGPAVPVLGRPARAAGVGRGAGDLHLHARPPSSARSASGSRSCTATSRTRRSSRGCRSTRAGACSTSPTTAGCSTSPARSCDLTKALDPTRPVVSNDGWEQVDTDIRRDPRLRGRRRRHACPLPRPRRDRRAWSTASGRPAGGSC